MEKLQILPYFRHYRSSQTNYQPPQGAKQGAKQRLKKE
jgi:hypothetical protein